ncbi:cytochrome protein [Macrophomina phaseolina]|uniref:Cytochrome protein n=1 Tax=Macrophomina phaseolina TaxID=35725 RepID=A0ABQ8FQA4_9PEZI|nr:cytochrome protein [Macrophomina phaseolina]
MGVAFEPEPESRASSFLCALMGMAVLGYYYWASLPKAARLPLINPPKRFELTTGRVRKEWLVRARQIIQQGVERFPRKPFNMIGADVGLTTILPPEYANEIRNEPNLSFVAFMAHLFFSELPGFEPTKEGMFDNDIGIVVIQKWLTQGLARMTRPLSEEADFALSKVYTDSEEWHEVNAKDVNLDVVARLSSRIFLGEELCRNEDWLRITVSYAVDIMVAAERLRRVPGPLRRYVHWFMPEAQKLRREVKQAANIIRPVLERRRAEKKAFQVQGKEAAAYNDAIEWFEQAAQAKGCSYGPEIVQLFLSTVAIHTTSDLLTVTLLDLVRHPDVVEALREEITSVLSEGGWQKTSLHNMKLLDSVIKESLRLKPIAVVSMRRVATADVNLSDGTHLPKGTKLAVSSHRMWDASVYERPDEWDGRRFLRLRERQGEEGSSSEDKSAAREALFVTTSERHLGFGHGKHACPGRFFASSELKVALCHILLKYDLSLPAGAGPPRHRYAGASYYADPAATVLIRRRREHVDLAKF